MKTKERIAWGMLVLLLTSVIAACGGGSGSGAVGPRAPLSLTATATSSGSIALAWTDGSDNESGFRVERGTDGASFSEIGTTGVNTAAYSDSGLAGSTKYFYRVRAYNSAGQSGYSNIADATTLAPPTSAPAGPSGLTANAASSSAINLAWTDNADNEDGFKIERSTSATTGFAQIASVSPNSTSYSDSGLSASMSYYYRVSAFNLLGASAWSNTANAMTQSLPGSAPAAPTNLTATVVSHSRIDLAWTDNSSNEDSFVIERSPDGSSFTELKTLASNITAYSDTGLAASTTYYYRVKASNTTGASAYSNTATGLTQPSPDTDGDGLSDDDEILLYGTNPKVADTDGDGWSDFAEIVTLAFNPDVNSGGNPYKFNPHLSDVPKMSIQIVSPPLVDLNYTMTDGSSKVIGTTSTRSQANTTVVTKGTSDSDTHSAESSFSRTLSNAIETGTVSSGGCSQTVSASVDVDVSLLGLGSSTEVGTSKTCFESTMESTLSTNMSSRTYGGSTTDSSTFTWSASQSQENSKAYSDAESFETASQSSISTTSGTIAVTVDIVNEGQMTFIPKDVALSMLMTDPADPKKFIPVGNLLYDSASQVFPTNALAPGGRMSNLTFKNSTISLSMVKKILRDPKGLVISVATYDVLDKDAVSFNFDRTTVNARTATVIIDYGDLNGRKPERYLVATDSVPNSPGVTVGTIFKNYLRMPYSAGTGTGIWNGTDLTGLLSVRDVGTVPANRGYWMAVHTWDDPISLKQVAAMYHLLVRPYTIDNVKLYSGHVLHLMYVEDKDKDNLDSLEERMFGSSDSAVDTDGDGLTDYDEVVTGWTDGFSGLEVFSSPAKTDTDGDGLTDWNEKLKRSDPTNRNTDGDTLPDNTDPDPITADGNAPSIPQNVTATATLGSEIYLYWSASTDAGGIAKYKIYEGSTFIKEATTTAAYITGLGEYTTHCYSVSAVDTTANESSKSTQACATTLDVTPPSNPVLTFTTKGGSAVSFSWTSSTDNVGLVGYYVYRNSVYVATTTGTTYSESGLAASTTYNYFVRPYDAAGNVGVSNTLSIKTAPAAPSNLAATFNGLGYMVVQWSDNSVDETGFLVERAGYGLPKFGTSPVCAPNSFATWAQVSGCSGTSCKDTSITSGASYCYRVKAYRTDSGVNYYSTEALIENVVVPAL